MRWILMSFMSFEIWAGCWIYPGVCQADWMQNLPDSVKQRPLSQLKLPGTHDSSAYMLNMTASIPMELKPDFNFFLNPYYLGENLAKSLAEAMTLTQKYTVFEQLEQGVRDFDFRIFYHPQYQEFYMSHSFATVPMLVVLNHIRQFMLDHPGEVLVIEMNDDKEHIGVTLPRNDDAIQVVRTVLGDWLIPVNNSLNLAELVISQKRILFTFLGNLRSDYDDIWSNSTVMDYWPNKPDAEESLQNIENYLPALLPPNNTFLNLIFFTVTPDQNSTLDNI